MHLKTRSRLIVPKYGALIPEVHKDIKQRCHGARLEPPITMTWQCWRAKRQNNDGYKALSMTFHGQAQPARCCSHPPGQILS